MLSGRREYVIGEEDWIGAEIQDQQLLDFPAEKLPVMITQKDGCRQDGCGHPKRKVHARCQYPQHQARAGIHPRAGTNVVDAGDVIEVVGTRQEVETAAKRLGYIDRPTNQTDMIFVGLGILVGGLFGALSVHIGGVPISLSTSGGALIAGLSSAGCAASTPPSDAFPNLAMGAEQCRSEHVHRRSGHFGRSQFCAGIPRRRYQSVLVGAAATALPLIIGLLLARYVFKFHPALALGCGRSTYHYGCLRRHTGCRRE